MLVAMGRWPNGRQFIVFDFLEHVGDLTRTQRICWTPTPVEWRFVRQMLGAVSA